MIRTGCKGHNSKEAIMAKEKNIAYGDKVKTGECFASFPHLDAPDTGRQYSDNKFKVDAIFLNEASMKPLVDACKALAMLNFKTIDKIKFPWKNGSEGSTSKFKGYPDHFYITPTTGADKPPRVVSPDPAIVYDPAKIYGGAIIRVNVTPKAYTMEKMVTKVMPDGTEKNEKVTQRGITLYLNAVQFVRDSERFGGADDPTGGFDNVSGGTSEGADF